MEKNRLEAFSDGVLAIIITIAECFQTVLFHEMWLVDMTVYGKFRFSEPKLRIFCEMLIRKPRPSVKTVGADWFRLLAHENYSPAVQVTEASMMPDFSPVALFTK